MIHNCKKVIYFIVSPIFKSIRRNAGEHDEETLERYHKNSLKHVFNLICHGMIVTYAIATCREKDIVPTWMGGTGLATN